MGSFQEIFSYLAPIHFKEHDQTEYEDNQIGQVIQVVNERNSDIDDADIVVLGCGEFRNQYENALYSKGPDKIREYFYKSYCWHKDVRIADLGNIMEGKSVQDTYSALLLVLNELRAHNKRVLLLGGSHELGIQQYQLARKNGHIIDFTVFDMLVDLNVKAPLKFENHLSDILLSSPNYIRNFNLIGFQSYYVNPQIIETLDRFGFDCIRVGKAREHIHHIEPILRSTQACSIDINCVRFSDAPANHTGSPNGFYGDEMCKLMQFAGMSDSLETIGLYGYEPEKDSKDLTAKLIAQMIWYFIDGIHTMKQEADFGDAHEFMEYNLSFTKENIRFLKSKRTNRWWMRMPDNKLLPCTYDDYLQASQNELPERWIREMERLV